MTLFDQLIALEFDSVKEIVGEQYAWLLKSDLKQLPPLPDGFLLGEVAIEVLKLRIARIQTHVDTTKKEFGGTNNG